jgi:Prenyltransferase and squalene oxidase repeat
VSSPLFGRLSARLESARNDDGGFGPRPGLPSEPEPTALATLALDDDGGRAWLASHQRPDGSLALVIGDRANPPDESVNDSATSLAALVLPAGPSREKALDHIVAHQAIQLSAPSSVVPLDISLRGWSWTPFTFGWIEPTSRNLLALQILRPSATAEITDAVKLLADRSCVGGGWNYGNREVWDTDLEPYAQTTAIGLIGLQGAGDPKIVTDGYAVLRRLWPVEDGGLSLALSLIALRLAPDNPDRSGVELANVEAALGISFDTTSFLDDNVALAWATLATGDSLDVITVPR